MHTIENRNGHCAFILSGADINNEPSSCTKHFYCPNIHRAIWEFSGPKTKQKNGTTTATFTDCSIYTKAFKILSWYALKQHIKTEMFFTGITKTKRR